VKSPTSCPRFEAGERQAAEKLRPLVYDELRRLAAHKLTQEKPGQTLEATALVHDVYQRLVGPNDARAFANCKHFFFVAEATQGILVENAGSSRNETTNDS
jgi:hypothetical protein